MPYSYNPLIGAKLDKNKKDLNDLYNVNTAGTVDGYVLTYGTTLDTWTPEAGGAGDMLKADYVTGLGTVYNASRLSGDVLATVQAHNVAASKVTSGTFGLARIPSVDNARIPNLETLSYGGAFASGQIPNLAASKITSGSFNANRIPSLAATKITTGTFNADRIPSLPTARITTGTFNLNRIPSVDDARIPNLETLSYGGAFATAQIPGVGAYKIASGTLSVARQETLNNLNGTVALNQIPTMDDDHIPNLDTLSYSGAFAAGQIPSLPTSKITSGTFGLARIPSVDNARIPNLETLSYGGAFATAQIPGVGAYKIASGTLGLARIPGTLTGKDADTVDGADAGVSANKVFEIPAGIAQGDIFHVNAGGSVVNLSAGTSGHFLKTLGAGTNPGWASVPGGGDMLKNVYDTTDNAIVDNSERLENNTLATVQAHNVAASKVTSGTFGLARIPAVDDARIPDVDTLSYSGAFAAGQIPSLPTSKITSGTFGLARIPSVDNARIPNLETLSYGGAFASGQIPNLAASKITSGTLSVARQETLNNLNGTVALNQIPTMDDDHIPDLDTLSYSGAFAAGQIPSLPTSKITSGTFTLARIPTMDDDHIPDVDTLSYGAAFATAQVPSISAYKIGLNEIHAEGTSNFAGPSGVTITHSLNLSNYTPTITPTEDGAGAIGDVWFTSIGVNSFVVKNSGIAVTAFTWLIHNRT